MKEVAAAALVVVGSFLVGVAILGLPLFAAALHP